jgi:hypothetical protein
LPAHEAVGTSQLQLNAALKELRLAHDAEAIDR